MKNEQTKAPRQREGQPSSVFFDIWKHTPPGGQNIPQWVTERARRINREPKAHTPGNRTRKSIFTGKDVLFILNKESVAFRSRKGVPLRRAVSIFGSQAVEYAMKSGSYLGETYCGCDVDGGRIAYFLTSYGVRLAAEHSNSIFFSNCTDGRRKEA